MDDFEKTRIIELINEVEERIVELKELVKNEDEQNRDNVKLYILSDVREAGGSVTGEELRDIAKARGMDFRGTGGLFAGKTPSLVVIHDDRRALTAYGQKLVEKFNGIKDKTE